MNEKEVHKTNFDSSMFDLIYDLKLRVANLEMAVAPLSFEKLSRIAWISKLLQPQTVESPLVRVGGMGDGGYVLHPPRVGGSVLSLGVGDQISADIQLIEEFGAVVYAFDPYVERPELAPEDFHFHKIGLGSRYMNQASGLEFENIHAILRRIPSKPSLAMIDIEGSEWGLMGDVRALSSIDQLVFEFHDLEKIVDDDFFQKVKKLLLTLTSTHVPIHAHGNNDGPTLRLSGAVWPGILEVTFLNKSLLHGKVLGPNYGPWPTLLDAPNSTTRPDLYLEPFFGAKATYREK